MSSLPDGIRAAFRLALRRPPIAREVDDEVAFHIETRVSELMARGVAEPEARAEALRRFGDTRHWSKAMKDVDGERVAHQRRAEWLDDLAHDVRFALRGFRRSPTFTALAIITLALGIGANAAVFGVVKSVLLNALPYRDADRVVRVYGRMLDGSNERVPVSAGTVTDMRAGMRAFESVSAFLGQPQDAVLADEGPPRLVSMVRTEPGLIATLGSTMALGRDFTESDAAADTAFNVILSHTGWQRLLGGTTDVIGRAMTVNGITRRVIGVLPAGFLGPFPDVDFYMPMTVRPMLANQVNARRRKNFAVYARLKPGVTLDAAQREITALAAEQAKTFPAENATQGMNVVAVRTALVGDIRTPLLVLLASAALVLVITCANLAGALLSRTISRRKEFAIRAALGAGRGRLVRQLLVESTLLAFAGGVAGVALAVAGLALLRGLAAHALPAYATLSLDTGALLVTGAIALATGLAFGAAPAFKVGRADPHVALRDETRGSSESAASRRLRGMLVAGQIALCVSLLAGAGLLARSLWAMTSAPMGFSASGVLSASVFLPQSKYPTGAARAGFMQQFEQRLRSVPGIVSVGSGSALPTRIEARNGFVVEGAPPVAQSEQPIALYMDVSDDYFAALGIPLRGGRTFSAQERIGSPLSLIINESMAKRYWPNGGAVGAGVRLDPDSAAPRFTVVGVVGDVRNDPARADIEPVLYLSNRQFPWNGPLFVIRTSGDPQAFVAPVRAALAEVDPSLPLHDVAAFSDVMSEGFAARRLPVVLMAAFGALALLLASVGVYAMMSAMAAAREREFAVRMALGSSRAAIAGLVIRQGAVWMSIGLAAGTVGIVGISRAVRSLLFGVAPLDPLAFAAAIVLLLVCAALALLVPVRRATRADPNAILR